jgi:hypothetical protein
MVDDTMPDLLASTPIPYVRILALEDLTALVEVCSQKLGLVFAPFCCSTVMNMTCQLIAQAYKK